VTVAYNAPMDRRGNVSTRQAPGRFRCLPCRRYVTGTESGHCPNCGFVPPSAPDVPPTMTSLSLVWLLAAAVVVAIAVFVGN
jgi:hypothetical protein